VEAYFELDFAFWACFSLRLVFGFLLLPVFFMSEKAWGACLGCVFLMGRLKFFFG
jgi:hypothetical protein